MEENNPIHVLIISLEYPPNVGGGGTYVHSLVSDLLSLKKPITISVFTSGELNEDTFDTEFNNVAVYRRASARQALFDTVVSAELLNDLRAVIEIVSPDVIHAHHSVPIIALKAVSLGASYPSIYTQHRTPEHPSAPLKLDGKGLIGEVAARLPGAGRWVAPSHFFKSRLLQSGINEDAVQVVWPSADYARFAPVNRTKARGIVSSFITYDGVKKLIVVPVVIRPRKDVAFVLDALRGVDAAVLITGVNTGSADDEMLRQQYSDISFAAHGPISKNQLATVFNAADAIVLSSTHEGFGIAAIEAASTGAPVFLRDAPGLNEIAAELDFVRQFNTTKELGELVKNVAVPPFDERLQRHQKVVGVFSTSLRAEAHYELYEKVIAEQKAQDQ